MDADSTLRPSGKSNASRIRRTEQGGSGDAEAPAGAPRKWTALAQAPARESGQAGWADGAQDRPASEKVSIELSSAQVDRVIRSAADGGSMSILLSGLRDVREVLAREPRQLEDSRLSRSLLAGLMMLASFPTDGSYLGNAEIARMLDMNPSTTHRYVSTLVAVGLLERDPATRRYRLV
ncbi:MAG: helix-turn-helix domain-containing protein [Solirubrobacteraceae bacterium]